MSHEASKENLKLDQIVSYIFSFLCLSLLKENKQKTLENLNLSYYLNSMYYCINITPVISLDLPYLPMTKYFGLHLLVI